MFQNKIHWFNPTSWLLLGGLGFHSGLQYDVMISTGWEYLLFSPRELKLNIFDSCFSMRCFNMYFISTTEIDLLSTRYIYIYIFIYIYIYIYSFACFFFFFEASRMPQADKMMIKHKIPAKFFHQKKSSRLSNPSCRTVRKSNALMNYEYGQGISVLVSSRCQEITATGIKPKMAHTNQRGFFSKKTGMLGIYI